MKFDLHSHSTYSDGALTPRELMDRAHAKGVDVLSITDHDTIDAYGKTAPEVVDSYAGKISLVAGIELSTQWQNTGIHVLGLNIDPASDAIKVAAQSQTGARLERARQISENLAKQGIDDAFNEVRKLAPGDYIGRPHFAQHIINTGKAKSMQAAFRKFLGKGKAGDVRQHWADLPQIIQWIRDANGIAVLAHPLKYKLTRTKLKRLLDSFTDAGGQGMEVVSGQQLPQQTAGMAELCQDRNLLASCGSDFHFPDKPWAELGVFAPLPANVTPVWERF
jgi:predicted metal-dependent phosphoesterase TrpH